MLNYERRGSGTPLICLHGIGHHGRAWRPVMDALADHHDVIAVDLPGFGESPSPPPYVRSLARLADVLTAFFAELGVARPHVVGNSMGGGLCLELAAAGAVSSVTALSPIGFATPLELRWAYLVLATLRATTRGPRPLLRATLRSRVVRSAAFGMIVARPARLDPDDAVADALAMRNATGFAQCAAICRDYQFTGAARADETTTAGVPVTIGWGVADRILWHRQAARARRRLPHARHVDLPGCGHVPMSDAPELVAELVLTTTGALDRGAPP